MFQSPPPARMLGHQPLLIAIVFSEEIVLPAGMKPKPDAEFTTFRFQPRGLVRQNRQIFKNSMPTEQIKFFEMRLDHITLKLLMQILLSSSAEKLLAHSSGGANY